MERSSINKVDKRLLTIIYLDRAKLEISSGSFQNKNELAFPPTLVLDCEVIDSAQFIALIMKYLDDIKLQASNFIVILSPNVVFSKTFPLNASPEDVESMQAFLANVPFENILTHVFRGEKDQTVIVANKEFVECVQQAFENHGFVMEASSPAFIFGPSTGLETGLTEINAKLISAKRDFARTHSFKSSSSEQVTTLEKKETPAKVKEKKRLGVLFGLFGLLFLVLIGVIIVTRPTKSKTPQKKILSKPVLHPTISPTTPPIFAVTNVSSDSAVTQPISVLSAGNSTDTELAQSILRNNGYSSILVTPNPTPSKEFVLYISPSVTANTRQTLEKVLSAAFPTLIVKNEPYQNKQITIILGKH